MSGISIECEGHVDDDEIIDYVLDNKEVLMAVINGMKQSPDQWAEQFERADSITRMQLAHAIKRAVPDIISILSNT